MRTLAVAASLLAAAGDALGCAVCGAGDDTAYWWSTLVLSLLPFGVVAAVGGVAWRLLQDRER